MPPPVEYASMMEEELSGPVPPIRPAVAAASTAERNSPPPPAVVPAVHRRARQ
jgi:hypothetical protein